MIGGSLSRRYAKALFELAMEHRREGEVAQEIQRFVAVYAGPELKQVLNNPAFHKGSRKNILVQVAEGLELSRLVSHFLCLLLERGRLIFLPSIAFWYGRLLDEVKGRVEARVVSASPLQNGMLERLREVLKRISGKEVIVHAESDPSLIGGVLIQLEGTIYDGSVRTQLEKMKERIERG